MMTILLVAVVGMSGQNVEHEMLTKKQKKRRKLEKDEN